MRAPTITDDKSADIQRLRERRAFGRAEDGVVAGEIDRKLAHSRTKCLHILEMPDLGKSLRHVGTR
jgi:hypothetical protein